MRSTYKRFVRRVTHPVNRAGCVNEWINFYYILKISSLIHTIRRVYRTCGPPNQAACAYCARMIVKQAINSWFACDVIAAMLVYSNNKVVITFFCCVHQHDRHTLCHLNPWKLSGNQELSSCTLKTYSSR